MNNTCYIGIDFSLNSPAFCIITEKETMWGSLTRTDRTSESLKKSKDKPYAILDGFEQFDLFFLDKKELPDDYSQKERVKIAYFQELVEVFWNKILSHVDVTNAYVAMEGLSFMSAGNALIDISMATALIRKKIIDSIDSERFHVFSPTEIKKFAGKGNFKKDEMYDSLVASKRIPLLCDILEKNRNNWITPSLQINKPVDDLVDATWISLFLKDIVEGNFEQIETKKKKTIKKKTTKTKKIEKL
jgi:hypothetical protein